MTAHEPYRESAAESVTRSSRVHRFYRERWNLINGSVRGRHDASAGAKFDDDIVRAHLEQFFGGLKRIGSTQSRLIQQRLCFAFVRGQPGDPPQQRSRQSARRRWVEQQGNSVSFSEGGQGLHRLERNLELGQKNASLLQKAGLPFELGGAEEPVRAGHNDNAVLS